MSQELLEAAKDLLTPMGYEVLELDVTGSGNGRRLLLRIDRQDETLVSMDDVTLVTDVFGLELDRLDPFNGAYSFNVMSPGSDRPLVTKRHFERFNDLKAKVKVGRESFKGKIVSVSDDEVSFKVAGQVKTFKLSEVNARLAEWPDSPR